MKGRILNVLKMENDVVSGEMLSSKLSVSRVSVWKHIKKLKELGYKIKATPKGYRITGKSDFLYPWEFPERSTRIHYYHKTASTMDIARDLARKQCQNFTVVIAGCQTKGRGRLQRSWLSSEGGLYFTIVTKPNIHTVMSPRVNFVASMIMAQTLQEMFSIDARVKWPNDILIKGKKVVGMLSEMEAEGDMVTFINIGMGVNINNEPEKIEPMAVSLKKILGKQVARKEILSCFLEKFEKKMKTEDFNNVIKEWKKYTMTIGQSVKIVTTRDEFEGTALDVDENGALILKCADGSIKNIIYGDCFILP